MDKKIVLLDDDTRFLAGISKALRSQYDVVCFSSSAHFMRFVCKEPENIQMVCIDLLMPDQTGRIWSLSGYEVIKSLRDTLKERTPFICAISQFDRPQDSQQSQRYGADDFILKSDNLNFVVREMVKRLSVEYAIS